MDNEERADLGAVAVMAAAKRTNVHRQEPAETAVIDVLSYVLHLCDRLGLDRTVLSSALASYEGDFEDGPGAVQQWDPSATLEELMHGG